MPWWLCRGTAVAVYPGRQTARVCPRQENRNARNNRHHPHHPLAARYGQRLHDGKFHLCAAGHRDRAVPGATAERPPRIATRDNTEETQTDFNWCCIPFVVPSWPVLFPLWPVVFPERGP